MSFDKLGNKICTDFFIGQKQILNPMKMLRQVKVHGSKEIQISAFNIKFLSGVNICFFVLELLS